MAQTPILGVRAVSSVPATASGIGTDPGTTGIPGDPSDVESALAELQAQIDAIGSISASDFLTRFSGGQPDVVSASVSGTYQFDLSLGNWFDLTLTGNVTSSTIINPPAATGEWWVVIRQGGTGSYTFAWPASFLWPDTSDGTTGGSAPTLWTAVGAQNVVVFVTENGGTDYGAVDETPRAALSLTVKDEGTPLATAATSLDFVGDGVVASGATAAKTITIPGYTDAQVLALLPPSHAHVDNVVFSGDGSTTVFILPAAPVDAYSVGVYVAGSRSQDWTLSGTLWDTLTFGSAPASATDNIVVDIAAAL